MNDDDPPPASLSDLAHSRLDGIQTRWTLLRQAHRGASLDGGQVADARRALVLRYAPAVRRYVSAMLRDDERADEVAQDAVVRLLKGDFAGADPDRGRFRDLLKTAVRNMVKDAWAKENRRAARPLPGDAAGAGGGGKNDGGPADVWAEQWRTRVLDLAWAELKQHERDHPASLAHRALRLRAEAPDDAAEELARRLSRETGEPVRADRFRQLLRRARVRFAEALVAEIGAGLDAPTPERIEDELIALGLHTQIRGLLPEGWAAR